MMMDLKKIRDRVYDYGLALYIVAAIVMLIIPLPDWLLDILLAFDMSLSFVIMFTYIPLIIKRIRNEEIFLEKELQGYSEYKKKVKYRLLPYIW